MTNQEMFDRVATYLLYEQAERSQGPLPNDDSGHATTCLYRKFDAAGNVVNRCAIGLLIPDEIYDPEMENKPAAKVAMLWPAVAYALGFTNGSDRGDLMTDLQGVHDRDDWRERYGMGPPNVNFSARNRSLRDIARKYRLDAHVTTNKEAHTTN